MAQHTSSITTVTDDLQQATRTSAVTAATSGWILRLVVSYILCIRFNSAPLDIYDQRWWLRKKANAIMQKSSTTRDMCYVVLADKSK
jgi:hypothetical protein